MVCMTEKVSFHEPTLPSNEYTPQVPIMSQVCIYPKEAVAVTGNGYQAGKRLLQRTRV